MKVGYIRVSTVEQNTIRQEVLMEQLEIERIYIDKVSGKSKERKALNEMLDFVRAGDVVIVESISRLARNTKDLLEIIEELDKKKVNFVSKKEAIDTSTVAGKFMLTVFGAMAELERGYILDRQKEGIAIAKKNGLYKGRKKIEINSKEFETLYKNWKLGEMTAKDFMTRLDLKPNTFYRRIAEYEGR